LETGERLPAARREDDAALSPVVDSGVEGGLLVVSWFDVKRRREIEVRVGPSGVFESLPEAVSKRCLLISVRSYTSPFEERPIPVGLRPVLVDTVIPLCVRNRLRSAAKQKGAVVELELHRGCAILVE